MINSNPLEIVDALIIDSKTKKVLSLLDLEWQFEESWRDIHGTEVEDLDADYWQEMFFTWLELAWEDGQLEVVDAHEFVIQADRLPESMVKGRNKELIL
jgi:hypothetical protein